MLKQVTTPPILAILDVAGARARVSSHAPSAAYDAARWQRAEPQLRSDMARKKRSTFPWRFKHAPVTVFHF